MKIALAWQATEDELRRLRTRLPAADAVAVPRVRPEVDRLACDPDDLIEAARDATVIMGWCIPSAVIRATPTLQFVAYLHAGCDSLDLELCQEREIRVANCAGVNAGVVAEHTMALLLGLAKRIVPNHEAVRVVEWVRGVEGRWSVELAGTTLLIVGLGRIGELLARRARAFDMRVIGIKRDPGTTGKEAHEVLAPDRLHDALPQARFVALTAPLTAETRHLIDEPELLRMRRDAFLVNVARGHLVRETAVHRALTEGWIAGYAADVWWDYPPGGYHYNVPSRTGIHRLPSVLASGNVATNIPGLHDRMLDYGIEAVAAFVRGEPVPSLIDVIRGY